MTQLKLMQIGFQLYVTGIAVADIDGPMNKRFALQAGVAIVVDAGLVLHINGWRALRRNQERNSNKTKNTPHDSNRPTVDEKPSYI